MRWIDTSRESPSTTPIFSWGIAYATVDAPLATLLPAWAGRATSGVLAGCTSSGGVFTPGGFRKGLHLLVADEKDPVRAASVIRKCTATSAQRMAREAAEQLVRELGRAPDTLLLHATPGFEERILKGIDDAFKNSAPPAYGGSAADNDLSGQWKIFSGSQIETEGFVLMGFTAAQEPLGAFVAGYLPTHQKGVVTRAQGRTVFEIDGAPAAQVYNHWRQGALTRFMGKTSTVLADTTLAPIGRLVDRHKGTPRYLLSHPHQIHEDGALSFFTEFAKGDEVVLMMGTTESLLERTTQVVNRARAHRDDAVLGGILIYCGGCVLAIGDKTSDVAKLYREQLGGAPFVGAATFGEIGCLAGAATPNRHGNLMCDTVLFR
ncbi:MAG: FIST N-terminal domain-containing protein [Deltaproteobacteria bacterium]|nr:FIST N-terminal domain-containing protein [Deltaproteobacteria bacterium]